jgi:hypothetical protein
VIESYKEEGKVGFESALKLAIPEYRVILENMKAYQLLYRFKYQNGECNLNRLSELIGCSINEVVELERNFDAYLQRVMNGDVRSNLIDLVCPECFAVGGLTSFGGAGEEIKKTCNQCVPPDTIIPGDFKPIQDYQINDLTTTGGIVLDTFKRLYDGDLVTIKTAGLLPITLTPEHPILTCIKKRSYLNHHKNGFWIFDKPIFKNAGQLTGRRFKEYNRCFNDYLIVPMAKGNYCQNKLDLTCYTTKRGKDTATGKRYPITLTLSSEIAWLLGLYVAEGSTNAMTATFSLGKNEKYLIERLTKIIKNMGYSPNVSDKRTAVGVNLPSRILARAFADWFGRGAKNKKIPDFILENKNHDLINEFLMGYLSGDGYNVNAKSDKKSQKSEFNWVAKTVSQSLALGIQLLAFRVGYLASIQEVPPHSNLCEGRMIHGSKSYEIQIRSSMKGSHQIIVGDKLLVPIMHISKKPYKGYVHNLHTQNNVYLVANAVVHNCGVELSDSVSEDTFDQSLDRDVTYAPTNHISWTKGMGGTFNVQKDLLKLLSNDCVCKIEHFENKTILAQFEPEVNDNFLVKLDYSAKELLPEVEIVVSGDKAFRRMGENIHWIPLIKFYSAIDEAFHSSDLYLRRKKAILESGVRSDLKNALEYGLTLCAQYGFNNKDRDQAFFNTVGREIRLMKHQLKAQRRHIPEKRLVETMVYICALLFDKKGLATRMKSELDIDIGLVNYYEEYKEFLKRHDKVDGSPMLLKALEQVSEERKTR